MWSFIVGLGYWNWLIVGAALFALEAVVPGVFLLWFGAAAMVTGVIAYAVPMALGWQVAIFALTALLAVLMARRMVGYGTLAEDSTNLNQRSQQYVGRSVRLESAIRNGRGRARVGDSSWVVEGPDTPEGQMVKVIGTRGNVLVVEPA